jgi:zinc protease
MSARAEKPRRRLALLAAALLCATLGSSLTWAGPLRLPPVTRAKLKNGLGVLVVPKRDLPLVDMRVVVGAGSVADPTGKEGVAQLCAELLTQGAGTRNARQLVDAVESMGGELEANSGAERCYVSAEVLSKDFTTGLDLLRDVVTQPTFAQEEFARKKDEALATIANDRNDPGTIADKKFGAFLLPGSPLGHPAIGTDSSVRTLQREDVVQFHRRYFVPDNAMLAIVGDVDPKTAIDRAEEAFKEWKSSGEKRGAAYAPVPQVQGRKVLVVDKADATQAQIRLGCIGVARNHPDYFPIMVARTILSVGFSSRLTDAIRVNQGLTYSIQSGFTMYRNAGTFAIETFTRNETIRQCIEATLKELAKLVDEGPTEAELERAKRFMTGQFPLGLQSPGELADRLLDTEFFGLPPTYLETYADQVNAVTLTDVRRALKSYFCANDLRLVVVADARVAKPALDSFGDLTVEPLN